MFGFSRKGEGKGEGRHGPAFAPPFSFIKALPFYPDHSECDRQREEKKKKRKRREKGGKEGEALEHCFSRYKRPRVASYQTQGQERDERGRREENRKTETPCHIFFLTRAPFTCETIPA